MQKKKYKVYSINCSIHTIYHRAHGTVDALFVNRYLSFE